MTWRPTKNCGAYDWQVKGKLRRKALKCQYLIHADRAGRRFVVGWPHKSKNGPAKAKPLGAGNMRNRKAIPKLPARAALCQVPSGPFPKGYGYGSELDMRLDRTSS